MRTKRSAAALIPPHSSLRTSAAALALTAAAALGLTGRAQAIAGLDISSQYNPEQVAVGNIFNNNGVATAFRAEINMMRGMDVQDQGQALTQLGGDNFGALVGIGNAATGAQTGAAFSRLVALREGFEGRDQVASVDVKGSQWYPGVSLADAIGDSNPGLLSDPAKPFGFYGSLIGADGRQFGANYAPGYNFNAQGFSVGADYRVADGVAVGVSAAYMHDHSSVDQGGGTVQSNALRYGIYGTATRGGWYADAYVGGGLDYYSNLRQVAPLGLTADSTPQGNELNARLGAGYDVRAGRLVVSPFAALAVQQLSIGSYDENGGGVADLAVNGSTIKSTTGALGLRVKRGGDAAIKPYLSLAYQHEFDSRAQSLTSVFAQDKNQTVFATQLAQPSQEAALVGLGFDARLSNAVTAHVSYDGDFRSDYVSHSLNADVRLKF